MPENLMLIMLYGYLSFSRNSATPYFDDAVNEEER
jgi:hypothetical protein